ncbi:MAG: hypothetical protein L0H64_07915, partial [Pseudonocardia sp.]|nr:hypothetical protein [Pseudonocardia sp.]
MDVRAPEAPGHDPATLLTGSPGAMLALREIVADPRAGARIVVVGPAGHGKSVLLDAVAAAYEAAGVPVRRSVPSVGESPDAGVALVVDDAHLLPAAQLDRLVALSRSPGPVVVAHRPYPEPPAMAALGSALAARRRPVVLGPLDRSGVAARAALLHGERPATDLVQAVLARTAGVPALVDRLLSAVKGTDNPTTDLPPALLAQLGYALDGLPSAVHDLLLARAVDAPVDPEVLVPLLGLASADALDELVTAAWAHGRLLPDGTAVPLVSAAVLARTPPAAVVEMRRSLAELELARGGDVVAVARGLLGSGATGPRIAAVFTAAADQAVRTGDGPVDDLYDAATRAGAAPLDLASR